MEKNLSAIDVKTDYRTGRDDAVKDFYSPCLANSHRYSRAVGYFRSSIFLITGKDVIDYAKSGGEIRLICSPSFTEDDLKAIEGGIKSAGEIAEGYLSNDIEALLKRSVQDYSVTVLATLIAIGVLKIKVAVRRFGSGIYHEKIGVFEDSFGNAVSFIGSANETWNAWHQDGNFESIEVFCSWKGGREVERVDRHKDDFNALWFNKSREVDVIDVPSALQDKLIAIGHKDIGDVDVSLLKPLAKKEKVRKRKIENLLPHQENAIRLWKESGFRGVFQHATGSGKTVTALSAIEEHTKKGGPAIILVPSKLLLEQWKKEITAEITDPVILMAGSGNTAWKKNDRLKHFLADPISNFQRIVLATMQTASSDDFLSGVGSPDNLLIVADEVHQIGSNANARAMQIDALKRLGLSATPQRYGDPDGTNKIYNYFGNILPPIITLYDAINAGRLCDYEYFPHLLNLSSTEAEEWEKVSKDIRKEIAIASANESEIKLSAKAKMLMIARSRIAKKASAKVTLAKKVIDENYLSGEKWLIYCEDQTQLNEVAGEIRSLGLQPLVYYSDMEGDPSQTLNLFQEHGGILVSIRCLDEGVDIPSISHALILASSQNPRQFIQRRGRVLRMHSSKIFAKIHDAVIVPISLEDEPDQMALLKSELIRAHEFSQHAINKSSSQSLELIANKLGFDINELISAGIEEDQDD